MKRPLGSVTCDAVLEDAGQAGHPFYGNQHIGGMSFKSMSVAEKHKAILKAKKILQPATMKTQSKENIEMAEKLLAAHGNRAKKIAAMLKQGKSKTPIPAVQAAMGTSYKPVEPTSLKEHAAKAEQQAKVDMPKTTHMLTESEFTAVKFYTGQGYREMNRIARGEVKESNANPVTLDRMKNLDKAIEKGKLDEPKTLYRGISRESASKLFGDEIKTGDHFVDKGYVSTSVDKDFAKNWKGSGGVVLQIEAAKGSTALDVHKMSSVGQHEREVMLPRNSKFEVVGVKIPMSTMEPVHVRVKYA